MIRTTLITALALGAGTAPAIAAADRHESTCSEFVTEFVDISALGRKNSAAEKMTDRANERAAAGWRQVDMEVYTENGDLEGFFMVFERTGACGSAIAD